MFCFCLFLYFSFCVFMFAYFSLFCCADIQLFPVLLVFASTMSKPTTNLPSPSPFASFLSFLSPVLSPAPLHLHSFLLQPLLYFLLQLHSFTLNYLFPSFSSPFSHFCFLFFSFLPSFLTLTVWLTLSALTTISKGFSWVCFQAQGEAEALSHHP